MRIGVWSFAHVHAPGMAHTLQSLPEVEFSGIADDDGARGRAAAERFGTRYFEDANEFLANVEAVVLESPNVEHRAMIERAAATGVHVLTDKPLATTYDDGLAAIAACREADVTLAIEFPCPFSPSFERLVDIVQAGQLGEIMAVRATNRGTMPGGWFIELDKSGGGAVMDHTVHVADLLRRLTGSEFSRVYAEIGHGIFHSDWDDSGILSLTMENDVFATLDCSWSRPESFPVWGDVTMQVIGANGMARLDMFNEHVTVYPRGEGKARWLSYGADLNAAIVRDFVEAVKTGRSPRCTGEDGLRALEVALAAYESARRGEPVSIDEVTTADH